MLQLNNTILDNECAKDSMIGKYIYMKHTNKEMDIYHIYSIKSVINGKNIQYETNKHFYFCIPFNRQCKGFCYDSKTNIELTNKDILYELSYDEWLNTFRSFVENDGKLVSDLPAKIIKDENNTLRAL